MCSSTYHSTDPSYFTETNNCEKYCGYQKPTGGRWWWWWWLWPVMICLMIPVLTKSLFLSPHQNIFMRSHKELHGNKVNPILDIKKLTKYSLELHVSLQFRGMLDFCKMRETVTQRGFKFNVLNNNNTPSVLSDGLTH